MGKKTNSNADVSIVIDAVDLATEKIQKVIASVTKSASKERQEMSITSSKLKEIQKLNQGRIQPMGKVIESFKESNAYLKEQLSLSKKVFSASKAEYDRSVVLGAGPDKIAKSKEMMISARKALSEVSSLERVTSNAIQRTSNSLKKGRTANINKGGYVDLAELKKLKQPMQEFADANKVAAINAAKLKNQEWLPQWTAEGRRASKQLKFADNFFKDINSVTAKIDKQAAAAHKARFAFQGWALSIMFAGQAIKNSMMQVWASSSKTFNEVSHSVEGTVTGFDLLDGSMKYLGFTIGQALEPVAAWLAPIIQGFADWVANGDILGISVSNIAMVLIPLLAVLGTAAAVGGAITLASSGFMELGTMLGLVSTKANGVASFDWANLGKTIQKAAGVVAIYWSLEEAKDAFKSFEDKKWVTGLLQAASAGLMAAGGITLLAGGTAVGGALFAVGVALKLVAEDKFFQSITSVTAILTSAFTASINSIGDMFEGIITKLKIGFNMAMAIANPTKALDYYKKANDLEKSLKNMESKSWGDYFEESYLTALEDAKRVDELLKDMKSKMESPTQITMSDMGTLSTSGVKQLVNEAFLAINAPSLFDNEKFQQQVLGSIGNIEINITQNPGESEMDFADRVVILLAQKLGLNYKDYV